MLATLAFPVSTGYHGSHPAPPPPPMSGGNMYGASGGSEYYEPGNAGVAAPGGYGDSGMMMSGFQMPTAPAQQPMFMMPSAPAQYAPASGGLDFYDSSMDTSGQMHSPMMMTNSTGANVARTESMLYDDSAPPFIAGGGGGSSSSGRGSSAPPAGLGMAGGPEQLPPLLEELGINFDHIRQKTMHVLNPFYRVKRSIQADTDLAGPLVFCLCLGLSLLLRGRLQFGYIFGVGFVGSVLVYLVMTLMSEHGTDLAQVMSTLGYCLLPFIGLSLIAGFIPDDSWLFSSVLLWACVSWCTWSASNMFVTALNMKDAWALVAYPVFLFYTFFGFMSVL